MKVRSTLCSMLGLVLLISSLKASKITLNLFNVDDDITSDSLFELELDTDEDNRQKMKTLLKEIRNRLLTKFKKNRKTRQKTGTAESSAPDPLE